MYWTRYLNQIGIDDKIILAYTDNSKGVLQLDRLKNLRDSGYDIEERYCFTGKDALDNQIIIALMCELQKNSDMRFIIMSNDTGFDQAIKYLNEYGVCTCFRLSVEKQSRNLTIEEVFEEKASTCTTVKALHRKALYPALQELGMIKYYNNIVCGNKYRYQGGIFTLTMDVVSDGFKACEVDHLIKIVKSYRIHRSNIAIKS